MELSSYRLSRVLEVQATSTLKIEHVRRLLVAQNGFSSFALFRHISANRDRITRDDIITFLKKHDVFINIDDAAALVARYTSNANFLTIGYQDFFLNLEFPKHRIKDDAMSGGNTSRYKAESSLLYGDSLNACLSLLAHKLQTEVLANRNLSILKQLLADEVGHDFYDTFRRADVGRTGFLSIASLSAVLKENDIALSEAELQALFSQYDANQDGRISYLEFLSGVLPPSASSFIGASPRKQQAPSQTVASRRFNYELGGGEVSGFADLSALDASFDATQLHLSPRKEPSFLASPRKHLPASDVLNSSFQPTSSPDKSFTTHEKQEEDDRKESKYDPVPRRSYSPAKSQYYDNTAHIARAAARDKLHQSKILNETSTSVLNNTKVPVRDLLKSYQPRKKCMVASCELPRFSRQYCSIHTHTYTSDARRDDVLLTSHGIAHHQSSSSSPRRERKTVTRTPNNTLNNTLNNSLHNASSWQHQTSQQQLNLSSLNDSLTLNDSFDTSKRVFNSAGPFSPGREQRNTINVSVRESVMQVQQRLEGEFEDMRRKLALHPTYTLLNAFEFIDRDSDGYISISELRDVMREAGYVLSPAELSTCILLFDSNGDGRISYAEFISKMMPTAAQYSDLVTTSGGNARGKRRLSIAAQMDLAAALKATVNQKKELDESIDASFG